MAKEYGNETLALMDLLISEQENCAPIVVSIGYCTKGGMVQKGIVMKEAPPVVIDKLIQNGYSCSLEENGLLIYKNKR